MKKQHILLVLIFFAGNAWTADWDGITVPPVALPGTVWELDTLTSDDFNYSAPADTKSDTFFMKWTEGYHNAWTGPIPTFWVDNHTSVSGGNLRIRSSQIEGQTITYTYNGTSYTQDKTFLGCVTNKRRVKYPVYVETSVKIMNSVLASDVWMLSPDDTQEIDICEAYGSDRKMGDWTGPNRLHLSHHVFIRSPFTDWQPRDEGSWYYDGSGTIWREDYHRLGVYWKDPWNLEYYVDGVLARTRSGKDEIDPVFHTNSVNPGDTANDTRTGLSKAMDIIINTEDQSWRSTAGFTPTKEELENIENNTFKVDWIRVYNLITFVDSVEVIPSAITSGVGQRRMLSYNILPENATVKEVVWSSSDTTVVKVDQNGWITGVSVGNAKVYATSNNALDYTDIADSCMVTIQAGIFHVPVDSIAVSPVESDLALDSTLQITVQVYPPDAVDTSITWESSDDEIALVNNAGLVSGIKKGSVTITATSAEGGDATTTINIINIITSKTEVTNKSDVLIYPNPANNILNLTGNLEAFKQVKIYNLLGSEVYNNKLSGNTVNVNHLENGVYMFELIGSQNSLISRIVIKH